MTNPELSQKTDAELRLIIEDGGDDARKAQEVLLGRRKAAQRQTPPTDARAFDPATLAVA